MLICLWMVVEFLAGACMFRKVLYLFRFIIYCWSVFDLAYGGCICVVFDCYLLILFVMLDGVCVCVLIVLDVCYLFFWMVLESYRSCLICVTCLYMCWYCLWVRMLFLMSKDLCYVLDLLAQVEQTSRNRPLIMIALWNNAWKTKTNQQWLSVISYNQQLG